ncbi:MAG: hypothetical protein JSV84_00210 [Gemmatimonadota bacterium]|nr:MAG: hypothetical protein JSV84_00210 [Gemmatimonadota bacterium]
MKRIIVLLLIVGMTGIVPSILAQNRKITIESMELLQKVKEQEMESWRSLILRGERQIRTQENFDALYYELHVRVFLDPNNLEATVTGRFQSLVDGLETVVLDFDETLTIDAVTGNVNAYQLYGEEFEVTLDRPHNAGEIFEITTTYHGVPRLLNDVKAFNFRQHSNAPIVATLSTPFLAHTWWPCKDGPEDKPDSVDIHITIPDESYNGYELSASSNGTLVDVVDNGDGTKTFRWHEGYPVPVYYVGICVSNYRIFSHYYAYSDSDSMEVPYYVFPESYNAAQETFEDVVDMIGFLSDRFFEYPFVTEKYAMSEIGFYGAIENQTNTIMGGVSPDWYMIVLHELAHQWFGDMITCSMWHHGWVNEGFASYCEALWIEHLLGFDEYKNYMASMTYYGDGTIYLDDVSDPFRVFVGIIYNKGAWVLHMLRYVVGDDSFWNIMRTYCRTYAYGHASTEDFQSVCESVHGQSLDWYFHQWIYEEGYPEYGYTYHYRDTGDEYVVTLFIRQMQTSGTLFRMPMDIVIRSHEGDVLQTVIVSEELNSYQFVLQAEPMEIILNPDNWILKEVAQLTSAQIAYQSHTIDDSEGNSDGKADPGETVSLFITLINKAIPVNSVAVQISTDDPYVSVVDGVSDFGDMDYFAEADNSQDPFVFAIDSEANSRVVHFTVTITGSEGYQGIDDLYLNVGLPIALLVDDDDGDQYEDYFVTSLNKVAPFDYWDVMTSGTPGETLSHYEVVVWFTGDDASSTLDEEEQTDLAIFLNGGGNLFVTGQNIGYDLVENGSEADQNFYRNYLHADYVGNTSTALTLIGVSGDAISGTLGFWSLGGVEARNQDSPDIIAPQADALPVFKYSPSGDVAAIRFSDHYKIVYFGFGFEGMGDFGVQHEQKKTALLRNILAWFRFSPQKGDVNEDGIIDVLDIGRAVNIILGLGSPPTDNELWAADCIEDDAINIFDLVCVVNIILRPR